MGEAYIIDAVRTPVGRRGGGLAEEHPADLGAHAIKGLIDRVGVDPMTVDDVIMGCLDNMGPQAGDIAYSASTGKFKGYVSLGAETSWQDLN